MNTRLFSTTALAACVMVVISCKKKTDVTADFGPLTAGSTWTYQATTSGSPASTYTLTATNRDTMINGRSYRVLTDSDGPNTYRHKSGNEYYSFGAFEELNLNLEQLYLKDNADLNATWESKQVFTVPQFPTVPFTATLIYKIKEKGLSRTVSGNNFSNVIKVGLTISVAPSIGEAATADFFYAPNVGLIESTYNVNANTLAQIPASTTTEILTSYSIK